MRLSDCLAGKYKFRVRAAELKDLRVHKGIIDYHLRFPEQFLSPEGKKTRIAGSRADQINPAFFFAHGTVDCLGEIPEKFTLLFL